MAKAYIYVYSGFPGKRSDKYYVCKYGKGRPITYQVVPHLQRHFDKQGRENKDTLEYSRFKELRRAGHLYTGKREKKRTPLLGDTPWRTLPEPWQLLGRWLSGNVAPGDVNWRDLGESLRVCMRAHPELPESVRPHLESLTGSDGQIASEAWSRLRREHLERAWYHHWPDGRLADLEDAPGIWDPEVLLERLREYEARRGLADEAGLPGPSEGLRLGEFPLGPLRRWTSSVALQWPEEGLRRAAGLAAERGADSSWQEILRALPSPPDRYECVRDTLVPVGALYDVQWEMAGRLQSSPWAASPWTATGRPGLVSRWHSGAASCLVVTLESRTGCEPVDDRLTAWLSGWNDKAREAATDILVHEGRIVRGSPMREAVSEVAVRPVDEAIAESLREGGHGSLTWRFCRAGRQLVVSSRESPGAKPLMEMRRHVTSLVRGRGFEIAENETSTFGDRPETIRLGATEIPLKADGRSIEKRDVDELSRDQLAAMHERHGDPRFATLADPDLQESLEDLAAALTLTQFVPEVLSGWYGDLD